MIGAFDEIIEFRPQLAAMPDFDVKDVDNLRDYACALGHAHVGNRATEGPVDATAELAAKLVEIRDQFVADGTAAAKRGLVSQPLIDKHRSGISYRMICDAAFRNVFSGSCHDSPKRISSAYGHLQLSVVQTDFRRFFQYPGFRFKCMMAMTTTSSSSSTYNTPCGKRPSKQRRTGSSKMG